MAGRSWIKLYERWLTSPSHAELSGSVLGTGALLLLVAEATGETDADGTRWILDSAGAVAGQRHVSRRTRTRQDRCTLHVRELCAVGTMVMREDGAMGFPKFAEWQENASAGRMRKHRARAAAKRNSDVTGLYDTEAEAEAEADLYQPSVGGAPEKQTSKPKSPRKMAPQETADEIKAHVADMRERLGCRVRRTPATEAERIRVHGVMSRLGYSLDDIKTAVYRQAQSLRGDPKAKRYMTLSTVCRYDKGADNIGRLLEREDLGDPPNSTEPEIVEINGDRFTMDHNGNLTQIEDPADAD